MGTYLLNLSTLLDHCHSTVNHISLPDLACTHNTFSRLPINSTFNFDDPDQRNTIFPTFNEAVQNGRALAKSCGFLTLP